MQTKHLKYLTVAAASVLIVPVSYAADKPADSTKEPSGAAFAHTCAACHGTYGYSNDSALYCPASRSFCVPYFAFSF